VWFANVHNPADARGPAGKWRAIATAKEGDLAASLGADGTPVIVTGDMNDKAEFYCPFTARSGMKASNGGVPGTPCQPPGDLGIDWILGSAAVSFSDHHRVDGGIVDRASDHPFVWAQATLSAGR
jgi:endonuclease/exonuclease/phosphatase family metal-dependent hydrolase